MRKFLLFAAFLLPYLVNAQNGVMIDGIYYNLEYGKATVVKNPNEYVGDITIPEKVYYQNIWYSVQEIGEEAFAHNKNMTGLTLPNTLRKIGGNSILGCTGLKALVIPEQVTDVMFGALAFNDLKIVVCLAKKVPTTGQDLVYASSPSKMILYVPSALVNYYRANVQWNRIKQILPIEDVSTISKETKQITYLNHTYTGKIEKKVPLGGGQIEISGINLTGIFIDNTIIGAEFTNGPLTFKGNITFDESDMITLKKGGSIWTEYYHYGEASPKFSVHQLSTDSIIDPNNFLINELPMTYSYELNVPKELFPAPSLTAPYTIKLKSGKFIDLSPEEKKSLEAINLNAYKDNAGRLWDYNKAGNTYKVTYQDGGFISSNNPNRMQYNDGSYYLLNDRKKKFQTDGSYKITYDDGSFISSTDSTRRIYPDGSFALTTDLNKRIYPDGTFILNGDESTRYNANGCYYKNKDNWKIVYPNGKYIEANNGYISTTDFVLYQYDYLTEDEIVKMYRAKSPYDLKKQNVGFKVKDNKKTDFSPTSFNKLVASNMTMFKNFGANMEFYYISDGDIHVKVPLGAYKTNRFINKEQNEGAQKASFTRQFGFDPNKSSIKKIVTVGRSFKLLCDYFVYWENCSERTNHALVKYWFRLSQDQGASKCYRLYSSNGQEGFIWVRGDRVSTVSWFK